MLHVPDFIDALVCHGLTLAINLVYYRAVERKKRQRGESRKYLLKINITKHFKLYRNGDFTKSNSTSYPHNLTFP